MYLNTTFFVIVTAVLLSCNDNHPTDGNQSAKETRDSIVTPKRIKDIEPKLWTADSLQVLYYDDPDGDSLRYTRFFQYLETKDTASINTFLNELNQVFVQQNNVKGCRSEGKLYLLSKEDVLKTIYFSTRGDTCSYFYFIKDGNFIYAPLSTGARNFLHQQRKLARKP